MKIYADRETILLKQLQDLKKQNEKINNERVKIAKELQRLQSKSPARSAERKRSNIGGPQLQNGNRTQLLNKNRKRSKTPERSCVEGYVFDRTRPKITSINRSILKQDESKNNGRIYSYPSKNRNVQDHAPDAPRVSVCSPQNGDDRHPNAIKYNIPRLNFQLVKNYEDTPELPPPKYSGIGNDTSSECDSDDTDLNPVPLLGSDKENILYPNDNNVPSLTVPILRAKVKIKND